MAEKQMDLLKTQGSVLGHPSGLFVLFFTEMWERFSYYGMRALLVIFLVSAIGLGGWDWPRENALSLYGTYTALVYITPILGGYIADRIIGYRWAVVIGALIMTLGHASMAIESHKMFLYIGIGLLIVGNGFFKPNMTSIISHMYKNYPEKKDGAYTIFYMGVNAGAFLGILLCGYLGEKVGWSYGFGLAGIFMFLGMLQFYFTQGIFGDIGKKPDTSNKDDVSNKLEFEGDRLNPFTIIDKILITISLAIGVIWVINDPVSKITGTNILMVNEIEYSNQFILIGLTTFMLLLFLRILRYPRVTRDRMFAIIFFALMTVIFWMCFEQAGGSMNIFAKDYTNRIMTGNYYYIYIIVNVLITLVPLVIITWVLFSLFKQIYTKYRLANTILGFSFVIIWGIVIWMINRDINSSSYVVTYEAIKTNIVPEEYNLHPDRLKTLESKLTSGAKFKNEQGEEIGIKKIIYDSITIEHKKSNKKRKSERDEEQKIFDKEYLDQILSIHNTRQAIVHYEEKDKEKTIPLNELNFETTITEDTKHEPQETIVKKSTTILELVSLSVNDKLSILDVDKKGKFIYLSQEQENNIRQKAKENNTNTSIVKAVVGEIKRNEVEIPATWFLILNSLFIITFAPLFSKWWESKYNPNASSKYGLGLILLGLGFSALAFGSMGIEAGAKTASVSLIWLVFAYLFHTLGELCLSPVALSYVSKLVPGRMIALMFGIWYIAIAIGNKLAGVLGSKIDHITESYNMTTFFLIFTLVPIILGTIGIVVSRLINKLMHGIR